MFNIRKRFVVESWLLDRQKRRRSIEIWLRSWMSCLDTIKLDQITVEPWNERKWLEMESKFTEMRYMRSLTINNNFFEALERFLKQYLHNSVVNLWNQTEIGHTQLISNTEPARNNLQTLLQNLKTGQNHLLGKFLISTSLFENSRDLERLDSGNDLKRKYLSWGKKLRNLFFKLTESEIDRIWALLTASFPPRIFGLPL